MKLNGDTLSLAGPDGGIRIQRNAHGIPDISGTTLNDLAYGLGFMHAQDRQLQILLTRILIQGRAAECLSGSSDMVELDTFMRRLNILPDPESVVKKLKPAVRRQLQSYADGINYYLEHEKPVFEFRMLGYTPEPWQLADTIMIGKVMGYLGLADGQGSMEKFLVEMIQQGVSEKKLKELFPYLKEKIDYKLLGKVTLDPPMVPEAIRWLSTLPRMMASNNWVVGPGKSLSDAPILCNDPHLEVNRIPAIWYEVVMRMPENKLMGASLPGVPGLPIGRSSSCSWGATYSFMDMIDYRIEECRDGKYRRGQQWKKFKVREEEIKIRKKDPVTVRVFENEHGILEGDPYTEGFYLVMNWSAQKGCGAGDINAICSIPAAGTAREVMGHLKKMEAGSWNWVVADLKGNIGYQMSGRMFKRPRNVSGLVPLPGWEKKYNPAGFVSREDLPSLYNPKAGVIVTANQDLNSWGKASPINLPMAGYRAERIEQLLKRRRKLGVDDMKYIHSDLHSLQAMRLMKIIAPMLPDTEKGRILKNWDCTYRHDATGAMLFESVYHSLLRVVFGDYGVGREVIDYLMKESPLFNDYYGNFDNILLKKRSAWYDGRSRDDLVRRAVEEGLNVKPQPYGKTRKITFSHLMFGGKLPRFLGFDFGPVELPGNRATVPQGQIFKSAGRTTTFSPSYRFITDMAAEKVYTNIAGGPSDRRFSKLYMNDMENWLAYRYKELG